MLAFTQLVLATRTYKGCGLKIYYLQLHSILAATSGQGLPFITIKPNPTAAIALVYLDSKLEKYIHLDFTFGALKLLQNLPS